MIKLSNTFMHTGWKLYLPSSKWIAVWLRNFLVWRKLFRSSMLSNIAEPLITLVAFGYGVGSLIGSVNGRPYILFLASGAICMSVMMVASFEALYSAYMRLQIQKTWESISFTPTEYKDIVLAEIIWSATKAFFSAIAITLVVFLLNISRAPTLIWVPAVTALVGLSFAALGMVITACAKSFEFFSYYFTLVLTPMTFLSGVYFPIETFPAWLQWFAHLLPLNAGVAIVRPLFFGEMADQFFLNSFILLLYIVVGYLIATYLTVKRLMQ